MSHAVLVPLDGLPLAERALPQAETLARALGWRLLLVRAVPPAVGDAERQVQAAGAYLAAVAARLPADLIVETVAFLGEPADAILQEVHLRGAELVAMATHSRSHLGGLLYGSVARAVLAHSPVPVLLLRSWQSGEEAPPSSPPRLVVPLDGSRLGEAALPTALALVRALGGEIVLLQVVTRPGYTWSAAEGMLLAGGELALDLLVNEASAYLGRVRDRLCRAEPLVRVRAEVRLGSAAATIAAAGREHGAALMVMASHGRGGVGRFLLGSVADGVLRQGVVPLVLVRPALAGAGAASWAEEPAAWNAVEGATMTRGAVR